MEVGVGWMARGHPEEPGREWGEVEAAGGKFSPCLHMLVANCYVCISVCKWLWMFCLEITKCFCKEGQGEASVLS